MTGTSISGWIAGALVFALLALVAISMIQGRSSETVAQRNTAPLMEQM